MQYQLNGKLKEWAPHWLTTDGAATYHHWDVPGPVQWAREWPELVAAREKLNQVNAWLRDTDHSDSSFSFYSSWGDDPVRTRVEIDEFPPDVVEHIPATG
ncbi:hypothetical protein [Nocardia salmonicida]|uniref:hypothetical protein n=1 Tax=Nocardia salmonicida TaxID=53431 RepID=UPI0007A37196|nr:hypothetical protein [Nocardia salmonicida]MBC7299500.1 hypothetical protein [Nocardia sp.]